MLVYPSLIYLQNHKTGCSFVEAFLRKFCNEPLLHYQKHAVLMSQPRQFCFTNVREPLSLYRSLFAYGLDGKGSVYFRFKQQGLAHFYSRGKEGFVDWFAYVTNAEHASLLNPHYSPELAKLLGFASWRFLRLACPGFERESVHITTADELKNYIKLHYGLGAVLRQERLRDELSELFSGRLAAYVSDHQAMQSWLAQAPKINASLSDVANIVLPTSLQLRLLRKEAFLYQNFYADAMRVMQQDIAVFDALKEVN